MKASSLLRGYLEVKRVTLPLAGVPANGLFASFAGEHEADLAAWRAAHPEHPEPPPSVEVGLRALSPGDEAEVFALAHAYAKSKGVEHPKEGDELYEYGKALHRCLLGVVDVDSDPRHPERFFDGGIEQIEGMHELGADGVLTLAEMHAAYQDEVSGHIKQLESEDGFRRVVEELAGPHGAPFYWALKPGSRVSSTLSMARLLRSLLQRK